MPTDSLQKHSLAYRKNADAILAGRAPDKYLRILPHVKEGPVLEIGAAEGVLTLLMAERGLNVLGIELTDARTQAANELRRRWLAQGRVVEQGLVIQGDATRDPARYFTGVATLVAVRAIYHLGDLAQVVVSEAGSCGVRNVVLCGNRNRAARWRNPDAEPYDYYSSIDGMTQLLTSAGYEIADVVPEGDPIVVGRRS